MKRCQRIRSWHGRIARRRAASRLVSAAALPVWIKKSAGADEEGFGAKIRSRTGRDAPFHARAQHRALPWRSYPVFPRSASWFHRRERSLVRLSSRAQRGKWRDQCET